jgi:hypothetical protein
MILFSLYTTIILAIHFENEQTKGWLVAVGIFVGASALIIEPFILLIMYYYDIKYHPASEPTIEPRVKEKSIALQDGPHEAPKEDIAPEPQEPIFEDVGSGQIAEDDISAVPRHAYGPDTRPTTVPAVDPSTVQIHRNTALETDAPVDLPPQEPVAPVPVQEMPPIQRPDTPIRAQTPFRAQTPAIGLTASFAVPTLPSQFRASPESTEQTPVEATVVEQSHPQSPPQTPPAAAVAMAEIQRMRQELARAKERAAAQTGSLGSELGRLAPLRSIGQAAGAAHRLAGLQAGRAQNAGRQSMVRGLALPAFGRNSTAAASQGNLAPERVSPKFGLPPLGSTSRPLPPELSNLTPTNRSSGSGGSGGLSALPQDSARRFSRRSGGSGGEGTGRFSNRSGSKSPKRDDSDKNQE